MCHRKLCKIASYAPHFILLLVALMVWWSPDFLNGGFFLFGDTVFPLTNMAIEKGVNTYYYLWNNDGFGYPQFSTNGILFFLPIQILDQLGIPLWILNRMAFIVPSFTYGLFTYYLARTLITGKYSKLSSTFASIFVIVSTGQTFQSPYQTIAFAGIPLLLAVIINGLDNKDKRPTYLFLTIIASLFLALGGPIIIVLAFGTISTYLLIYFIIVRHSFDYYRLKFLALTAFLIFLTNFFWIVPLLEEFLNYDVLSIIYKPSFQGFAIVDGYAQYSSILYTSRLFLNIGDTSHYFMASSLVILLSFALPIYVYLLMIGRNNSKVFALITTALILTFFSTGAHYPWFKHLYVWLWDNVFVFRVLNNNYYFLYVLSFIYAVLIGITTQKLLLKVNSIYSTKASQNLLSNNLKYKIIIIIVVSAIIITYGGTTLGILGSENTSNPAKKMPPMNVPTGYNQLLYNLSLESDVFRVLILPPQSYVTYLWYPYDDNLIASGILPYFIPQSIVGIGRDEGSQSDKVNKITKNLKEQHPEIAANQMKYLSIRYILITKDLKSNYNFNAGIPSFYIDILNRFPENFFLIMDTTEFALYELQNPNYLPIVFTSEYINYTLINNGTILKFPETAIVAFDKISPTEYLVKLNSTSLPYVVLNEQYSGAWIATVNGKQLNNHFQYMGYANAWYIGKMENTTVNLQYLPQSKVFPSILISIFTLLISLCYFAWSYVRKRIS